MRFLEIGLVQVLLAVLYGAALIRITTRGFNYLNVGQEHEWSFGFFRFAPLSMTDEPFPAQGQEFFSFAQDTEFE